MSTHKLKGREIPLDDSWDVIVVGGGPAGCTAATAAAAGYDVRAVDAEGLRARLREQGAYLPPVP